MKRVLLVDDDPIVLRIYRDGLSRRGFHVETAPDGLLALSALRAALPDVVVLDLMMPKLSGVDALKFIRGQPEWATLPVIVLSNSYMTDQTREAAALGAQRGLLKVRCTPALLAEVIDEVLERKCSTEDTSHFLAVPGFEATEPRPTGPPPAGFDKQPPVAAPTPSSSIQRPQQFAEQDVAKQITDQARRDFLKDAEVTSASLRQLFLGFCHARDQRERELALQELYREVHCVTALGGMADCRHIAHMAAAFEAVLFAIITDPGRFSPSLQRTMAQIIDFFDELFQHPPDAGLSEGRTEQVLVVDDDPVANQLAVTALRNAQIQAQSVTQPREGLRMLGQSHYDLILLDIEMPDLTGFEFCQRLRATPGYKTTPVIFVTVHSDFKARVEASKSGGDDLIAKPILPMELAAKVVMHLLRNRSQPQSVPVRKW